MNDTTLTNFTGVGATLEGLNNPVVYELLFDRVWVGTKLNLATWIRDEACARAGVEDPMSNSRGTCFAQRFSWMMSIRLAVTDFFQQPPTLCTANTTPSAQINYNNEDLVHTWELFCCRPEAKKSKAYQRDLVDTTRQALGNLGMVLRQQMAAAYDRKDARAFQQAARQFMALGHDLDKFLGTRSEFMLGKWIDNAESWVANKSESEYYQLDARSIITIWGGGLTDYAGRHWNGVLRDYHLTRWQMFINTHFWN